jgi:predicted nucleotide-binding protein
LEDDEVWRAAIDRALTKAGFFVTCEDGWIRAILNQRSRPTDKAVVDLCAGSSIRYGIDSLHQFNFHSPQPTLVMTSAYMDEAVRECIKIPCVKGIVGKRQILEVEHSLSRFLVKNIDLRSEFTFSSTYIPDNTRSSCKRDDKMTSGHSQSNLHMSTVFVIHGRDLKVRDEFFAFLRCLGLTPLEWEVLVGRCSDLNPFIGDVIARGMNDAAAIVVLLTGDEIVQLKPSLQTSATKPAKGSPARLQSRANVIFEAGYALAVGQHKTIIVTVADTEIFSDIHGRHTIRFDGSPTSRNALATRLHGAGCIVNTSGSDWLNMRFNSF